MDIDDVRAAIEQHVCVVAGVPYHFRLEWCATEKYVEPVSARTLLNVECIATADSGEDTVPLHLVLWLTDFGALPAILQDALHTQLARSSGGADSNQETLLSVITSTTTVH